jgi:4-hydroxy-tetrahydrodipicolinate synthase
MVIGVSAPNKFEAAEYAQHAAACGAPGILTLPQMDMNPTDPAMMEEYLSHICKCCELPLIVQTSYPGVPSAVSPGFLINLSRRYPQIQYVKEEQLGMGPLPWRISEYVRKCTGSLKPFGGAGARNLLNELRRGSFGTMPGAGFADVHVCIWNLFQRGLYLEAREVFAKMLMMAVLEQVTGYVLQKEILRRRGIFMTTVMRSTRRVLMDEDDLKELDDIFLALQPYCISQNL